MTRKMTKTAARYWTEDEDNCLIKYYPLSSWDEILNMLPNRSRTAITARASHLGLKKDSYFWPKADIDILVNNYGKCSIEELCELFEVKHTHSSIQTKAQKMNLTTSIIWTDEEIEILKNTYSVLPIEDILKLLPNRTYNGIIGMAGKLCISSKTHLSTVYSDSEINFIKENWTEYSDVQLAEMLGRSRGSVKNQRHKFDLLRQERDRDLTYDSLGKFLRGNIYNWKLESMKQCNYQCILTGSKEFEIHHLYSFHIILNEFIDKYNIIVKTNINDYSRDELDEIIKNFNNFHNRYPLGICLSKDLHILFHYKYGKNNTPDQFQEFLNDYKSGKYN